MIAVVLIVALMAVVGVYAVHWQVQRRREQAYRAMDSYATYRRARELGDEEGIT